MHNIDMLYIYIYTYVYMYIYIISSVQCREATSGNRVEEAGVDLGGGGDHIYIYIYIYIVYILKL